MFQLISVTRRELWISENYYQTRQEAFDAMVADIVRNTSYNNLSDIIKASKLDECGISDDDAWAETTSDETEQWKIVEVPDWAKYQLISVTELELDVCESFHQDEDDAWDAMYASMLNATKYDSVDEMYDAANAGECGFSDNEAWAITHHCGIGQWKVVDIARDVA